MSESIWKKEIHLGRSKKPKGAAAPPPVAPAAPPAAAAPEARQSIWKKEIHLGRSKTPKAAAATPELAPAPVTAAPAHEARQSIWKKEIQLGRSKKPTATAAPVPPPPLPEPAPAGGAGPAPFRTPAPVWPPAPAQPVDPAPSVAPVPPSPPPSGANAPAPTVVPDPPPFAIPAPAAPPLSAPPVDPSPFAAPAPPPAPDALPPAAAVSPDPLPFAAPPPAPEAPPVWPSSDPSPFAVPPPAASAPPSAPVAADAARLAAAASAQAAPAEAVLAETVPVEGPPVETPPVEAPPEEQTPVKEGRARKAKKAEKRHAATHVVGLRIGSSQLAAAHVANNGSRELVRVAYGPIERGLVVAGEVRDAEGLTSALKDFFASNKLPRKGVRLGIASNRIGVRVLDVPAVEDEKQFENAIRFRAQELLPIAITDAILDHVLLEDTTSEEGEPMRRVLLVFAHRELVTRFVDVCRGAGVRLTGIDLDAFGLLRAVAGPRPEGSEPEHAVVAVAIGHERTILAVADGRVCALTRVLEWGSSALDVAIARTLDLAPSEAEPIKLALTLEGGEIPEGMTPVQLEALRAAARTEIAVLGRELVSSLRFYQSRPDSLAIGELLLTGGGSQLPGLAEELQRMIGAPVRVADPLARVQPAKRVKLPADAASLAIAIGLGIED